jgi:hypothetical protein
MADRLFVAVLGYQRSGKSTTWNELFGRTVHSSRHAHTLELLPSECVEVFLISGSNEERRQYAGDVLKDVKTRIVLCSVQYVDQARHTLAYAFESKFEVYVQWLNPGYDSEEAHFDNLGFGDQILAAGGVLCIRDGNEPPSARVQEIREHLYGWARFRKLIFKCS